LFPVLKSYYHIGNTLCWSGIGHSSDKSIIGSSSHQFDAHAYVAILEDSVFQFYRESEKQKKA
jgi:hypothetical protein